MIPIGTDSRRFNGTFDGTTTHQQLQIASDAYDRGLFGSTNTNAGHQELKD